MSLTVEQSRMVSSLRLKMVENMQAGKDAHEGIDENVLREALEVVRRKRSIGAAGAGTTSAKSQPNIPIDLDAFADKVKSRKK